MYKRQSGHPLSVDKNTIENGITDCDDGSDECKTLFSDRYEMISNLFLRILFWLMGLVALIGNLLINISTLKDVIHRKIQNMGKPSVTGNNVKSANDIFIMNLSASDFLMGVYLIGVVAQGVSYSGNYCFVDKQWRSSKLCSVLGSLAFLSSETLSLIHI